MKKRILSILLAALMLLTLLPVTALADETGHPVSGHTGWAKISDESGLKALFAAGGSGYLADNITLTEEGGLSVAANVNLCLNGKVLNLNGKGNITVNKNKTFNLYDCDNTTVHKFGDADGLWTWDDTLVGEYIKHTVTGGLITGNTTTYGGVSVSGSFTMNGGSISGNTVKNMDGIIGCSGGGVSVGKLSSFTMTGGSITGNTVIGDLDATGGGVIILASSFTMTGGSITGNTAPYCGGVAVDNNSNTSFKLGGKVIISGNKTIDGKAGDIFLVGSSKITLATGTDAFAPKGRMGVTVAKRNEDNSYTSTTGPFTTNGTADDAKYFTADDNAYKVAYNDEGYLELVEKTEDEGGCALLRLLRVALVTKLTVCTLVCGVTSFVRLTARIAAAENAYIGAATRAMWAAAHMAWLANAWHLWH